MNKSFNETYFNENNGIINRNKVLNIINNEKSERNSQIKRRSHPIVWRKNESKILS